MNSVKVSGEIKKYTRTSVMAGRHKYICHLDVKRMSGLKDEALVLTDEVIDRMPGIQTYANITGELVSWKEGKTPFFAVLPQEYEYSLGQFGTEDKNFVNLTGTLLENPTLREVNGGKKIADFLLKIYGSDGRTSIIPCIAWNKGAELLGNKDKGAAVSVYGRLQSRQYSARGVDGRRFTKTAYEVSAYSVRIIGEGNRNED